MATFLISILFFGIALLAMSVGVLCGREPIRGSCGGVEGRCATCTRPCERKHTEAAAQGEEAA